MMALNDKKDYEYYNDQKHERKQKCLTVVGPLQSSDMNHSKKDTPTSKIYCFHKALNLVVVMEQMSAATSVK